MKRFYRDAAARESAAGFIVTLDGKEVRTPAKALLAVPSRALAEAIAAEWQGQGEEVRPSTLPLTRLCSTAVDRVMPHQAAVAAETARFAATDLVCYRVEIPDELVIRQHHAWQPLLGWVAARFGAELVVTTAITPVAQPPESLARLTAIVAALEPLELVALHLATAACGSLVLGLALYEGVLDEAGAFAAAELEASFEIERWGEDDEQTIRRAALEDDLATAARFLALLRAG